MWIIFILSFIGGCFIAIVCEKLAETIVNRDDYTDKELKERLSANIAGLTYLTIVVSTIIMLSATLVVNKEMNETKERIERLESLNQVDTIVVRHFVEVEEEDLK